MKKGFEILEEYLIRCELPGNLKRNGRNRMKVKIKMLNTGKMGSLKCYSSCLREENIEIHKEYLITGKFGGTLSRIW